MINIQKYQKEMNRINQSKQILLENMKKELVLEMGLEDKDPNVIDVTWDYILKKTTDISKICSHFTSYKEILKLSK